jgi:hypothetical protein
VLIYQEKRASYVFVYENPVAYGSLCLLCEAPATANQNTMNNEKPKNRGGRPAKSDTERRDKRISFAVTEAEYKQLQELAGHGERVIRNNPARAMPTRKRSIANIIREMLKGRYRKPSTTQNEELKALTQLAGMARNLNQLAAQANAQGYGAVATRSDQLATEIREIISRYDRKS